MASTSYRAGMRAAIPLALAVGGFGVPYGVLARQAGMGVAAPLFMSATTFAGSAQFAAASILDRHGTVAAAVLAAVLLNSRYLPIGLTVAPDMGGRHLARLLRAQLVVDESWVIGHDPSGRVDARRVMGAGTLLYLAWVAGTLVGLLAGDLLGDPGRLGLDAAFPALFLGLLAPQLHSRRAVAAAVLGAFIALVLVPLTPAGVPVVAASLACVVGLRGDDRRREPGPR